LWPPRTPTPLSPRNFHAGRPTNLSPMPNCLRIFWTPKTSRSISQMISCIQSFQLVALSFNLGYSLITSVTESRFSSFMSLSVALSSLWSTKFNLDSSMS
jgi:hypothetical protein